MNKSQMILAAIGGTTVVGALVLGYFIWDASSVKSEKAETLESSIESARGVMKKLPVKADKAELQVYADSVAVYDEWRAGAAKIAASGDIVVENTSSAEFKTTMVGDARRLASLPGCFDGKLVKGEFGFGFPDYITGGAMPPKDEAGLKRLQREWNDVSSVLKTLAECGESEIGITGVQMGKAKVTEQEEEQQQAKSKKGKAKKNAKPKKGVEEEKSESVSITSFTVDFVARPSALVKTLNAFATKPRFVVVENCTFVREKDELAEALGDASKGGGDRASSGRKRGRKAQQEEKTEAATGFVTDPMTAPLMKVTMAISVYDFGTLEQAAAEAKAEAAKEGEAK